MTEDVLSALLNRRREITGRIEECRAEIKHMMLTLEHLDATIREFQPEIQLENAEISKTRPGTWAGRGESLRLVYEVLRLGGRPMTVAEITREVMREKGMKAHDKVLTRVINRRVSATLRAQRDQGRVVSVEEKGKVQVWCISD